MRWAIRQPKLRHVDHLVLIALADHTPKDGTHCWVRHATIAEELGVNVTSVRRAIVRLDRAGLVVKVRRRPLPERRGRGSWEYRLAVDNAVEYRAPARTNEDPNSAHPRAVIEGEYRAPESEIARTGGRAEALEAKQLRAREDCDRPANADAPAGRTVDNGTHAGMPHDCERCGRRIPLAPVPRSALWCDCEGDT